MFARATPAAPTGAQNRRWAKLNIPMLLDGIVLGYFLVTFFMLGDGAILSRNPSAALNTFTGRRHHGTRTITTIPVGNAWADMFLTFWPHSEFFHLLHAVPDMVVCLIFSGLTLWSLHTAALGDPGVIPASWGQPPIEAQGPGGSPGYDVTVDIMNGGVTHMSPSTSIDMSGGSNSNSGAAPPAFDGRTPSSPDGSGLSGINAPGWSLCDKCDIWRPPRAHHCRECRECIARYDHHCIWIDNCVGHRNHKCFWLFLLYISICINHAWFMFARFWLAESVLGWLKNPHSTGPILLMLGYYMIVLSTTVFAAMFYCNTTWGMMKDETTVEGVARMQPRLRGQVKKDHVHHVPTDSDDDGEQRRDITGKLLPNPNKSTGLKRIFYAKPRRWLKNMTVVLGPNPALWLVPYLMPLQNPLTGAVSGSISSRVSNARDV